MRQTNLFRRLLQLPEFFFIFNLNRNLALPLIKPRFPPLLIVRVSVLGGRNSRVASLGGNFALAQLQVLTEHKDLLVLELSHLYVSTVCYVWLADVLSVCSYGWDTANLAFIFEA